MVTGFVLVAITLLLVVIFQQKIQTASQINLPTDTITTQKESSYRHKTQEENSSETSKESAVQEVNLEDTNVDFDADNLEESEDNLDDLDQEDNIDDLDQNVF